MCYHDRQLKKREELEDWYDARFHPDDFFEPAMYNGFAYPATPVIINKDIHIIEMYHWGLIPSWATDTSIRTNTLNAKIETIAEKPSFKNYIANRCLILIDGFYEWQWLDEKGKIKHKFLITFPEEVPFALAGLYNAWTDRQSGEIINSYTILTTEANELMARIHNTKKRMPVMLRREDEVAWLKGEDYMKFAMPDVQLVATQI